MTLTSTGPSARDFPPDHVSGREISAGHGSERPVADALSGPDGTTVILPFVTDPLPGPEIGGSAPTVTAAAEIPAAAGVIAERLGTAPAAVVVAAHLRALGLLASEDEVTVEISAPGSAPSAPVGFGVGPTADWAQLVARSATALGPHTERVVVRSTGVQLLVDRQQLAVTMSSELRDSTGVRAHLAHLLAAVAAAAADPTAAVTDADLLTDDDRALNARLGTGEILDPLPDSLFGAFEGCVARHPERTAVVHREARWSYRTLLDAVHTVHRAVESAGIRPGQVVGVALDRGPFWIAAVLGILRSGAVYLPLDPRDPPDRRAFLLERSGARLVVDGPASLGLHGDPARIVATIYRVEDRIPVVRQPDPFDPAYVYFTSGSTGEPKGALCGHGGMDNHLWAKIRDFGITADDVVLQSAQTTFDISLWQFAAPLMVGARVLVADHAVLLDVPTTLELLAEHAVTIAQVVPSYLAILLDHLQVPAAPAALAGLRCLSVTGEAISIPIARRLFEVLPDVTLINAYGATEASDDTTHEILRRVPDGPSVPVGRPNINVVVHVLDAHDRPVPAGSIGEITFSGIMVGLGYLGDAERTAAAFCPDPVVPDERLYRSGDYGRWLPGGTLQFHGRRDEQVKIAGIRLELGEIEFRLRSLPDVGEAAVVTVASGDAKELAGFVTASRGTDRRLDLDAATRALRTTLPAAAVPTTLLQLDALPLNGNGKVDKKALARIATAQLDRNGPEVTVQGGVGESVGSAGPPTTAARVRAAWAGALEIPVGGLDAASDFFALGGTSIRALRAVAAADRLFGIADLFARPTLGDLLTFIEQRDAASTASILATPSDAAAPLLLPLVAPAEPLAHLVFLPPAGASALIAREFAAAVEARQPRVRVSALQHPGQGAPADAPLPSGAALADTVAAELANGPELPILLWGQGSGAATAIALARTALPIESVFLASQPARDRRSILRTNAVLAAADDEVLVRRAAAALGIDPDDLERDDRQRLGRLYRHESMQSQLDLLDDGLGVDGPGDGPGVDGAPPTPLPVPLVLVRALDDDTAAPPGARWPGATELTVDGGGALFCRTRPELAAAVLTDRLRQWVRP